jgi:hypothetical protein
VGATEAQDGADEETPVRPIDVVPVVPERDYPPQAPKLDLPPRRNNREEGQGETGSLLPPTTAADGDVWL